MQNAFKKIISGLILLSVSLFAYASSDSVLNVYIGSNYIADPTIKRLEESCKCRLAQNYFNDNEEMLAKMVAGATGYNDIVATSYAVDELAKMGKIMPLDKSRIPNLKNMDPKFMNQEYDPGNKYSVPYAYNPVFLAYNEDKMKELGVVPNTWAVVFESQYLKKMRGKVTMFSSSRHVFAAALLYLGKDPNSEILADLEQAREVIDKASPYWARFDSDSYYRGLLRGDIWLSMSYSIDIYKTLLDAKGSNTKINIGATLQKEGNMSELDNIVIPKSTPNLDLSYEFINNALLAQSAYELSVGTGSSIPNMPGFAMLDKSVTGIDWIYPKDMSKIHIFNAYEPKIRIIVNEMWTEILMQCHDIPKCD